MQCEVCGRKIVGKQFKAIIEGAKMLVCSECAHYGTRHWEAATAPKLKAKPMPSPKPRIFLRTATVQKSAEEETLELIEEYSMKIRRAREKLGFSHEDLGKKINEKVSLLRKIETGKMKPTQRLAEKLEHTLKIRLLALPKEPKLPSKVLATAKQKQEITFGDLIKFKGKTEEK